MGVFTGLGALGMSAYVNIMGTNSLYVAAFCGALCTVRKKPPNRAVVNDIEETNSRPRYTLEIPMPDRYVQGICICPEGYELAILKAIVPLRLVAANSETPGRSQIPPASDFRLPNTYNIPKTLISLIQAFWAISTLYTARGEQIQKYGYAAFGFTVVPYAVMSVVNLLANLFVPEYPCLYLVSSPDMEEAIRHGGVFQPVVAELVVDMDLSSIAAKKTTWRTRLTWRNLRFNLLDISVWFVSWLAAFCPLMVVGFMSQFEANESTMIQRAWITTWTIAGLAIPLLIVPFTVPGRFPLKTTELIEKYLPIIGYAPAIGGMIVVGYMIQEYGVCTAIS
ncbi:hypothetical protein GQ53DRAFT_823884 [Thozetella sp. PMI_491]|nr:hypothetical protein GQ53DRAFT_823884 [Thozetella sp. PMI_491]